MNATHTDNERFLDACIEAMREEGMARELHNATQRFRAGLPKPQVSRKARLLRWAGAGLVATLIVAIGPQLVPGDGGQAFAAVRAWFKTYRTVHMETVTTQGAREISRMDIWARADGAMRLKVGPIINIVNPGGGTMHTLLPGHRVMTIPVHPDESRGTGGAMKWIRDIRDFQGRAKQLAETRTIAGESATGYRLRVSGTTVDLWASSTNNRPLLMEVDLGGNAQMRSRFEFDKTPPANAFSVPPGYSTVQPED
ncbi:MAG: hypothetical protein PVJ40_07190 [Gammaproteobacteria bacterium]|jgi:hypothetical protein